MKRFQSVSNVQLNTMGRAALLELRFTDGSSDAVEIECDRVGGLISALLKTCAMLGHRKPPQDAWRNVARGHDRDPNPRNGGTRQRKRGSVATLPGWGSRLRCAVSGAAESAGTSASLREFEVAGAPAAAGAEPVYGLDNWRRERDSNPRRAFDPYTLSRGAPSTTRPSLRRAIRSAEG